MKKIISLLLVLMLICSALVSCSDDGAPDGMKSATVSGEPFVLYVPETFTENTSSGLSSAYYVALENSVIVTARYYTPSEEISLDEYMNMCAESYAMRLDDFRKTSEVAGDMLGGEDARRLEYKMTKDEKTYTVIQRTTKWQGDFVSLNLYATGSAFDVYADYISDIVTSFTLKEKDKSADVLLTDDKTPEGMRIASSDIVEYRLYVPTAWVCDPNSGVSEAYIPEARANVTVTSYSPDAAVNGKTISEYCDFCVDEYKKTVSGFTEIEIAASDIKVAGKDTLVLTFGAEYDGVSYKISQIMFYASEYNLYYSMTYTATADDFDAHLDDFFAMASAFCFR